MDLTTHDKAALRRRGYCIALQTRDEVIVEHPAGEFWRMPKGEALRLAREGRLARLVRLIDRAWRSAWAR